MRKRLSYFLIGGVAGALAGFLLQKLGVPPFYTSFCWLAGALGALWYGVHMGRVPRSEEVHRPVTLFRTAENSGVRGSETHNPSGAASD